MIIVNQPAQPIIEKEIKESKKDPKVSQASQKEDSKGLFNKQDLQSQKLNLIEEKLAQLTNKLLAGLKAGDPSPNNTKALQVAPNLASDLKDLLSQLEGNEKLQNFKAILKEFTNPIENIKASHVAKSLENSGIMLEAKIAQALQDEALPAKIKDLLSQMKNINQASLKEGFLNLPNDSDANKSIENLEKLLQNEKKELLSKINTSPLKTLIKSAADLQNAVKYLDKLSNLSTNINKESAAKALMKIETLLNNASKGIQSFNLNSQNLSVAKGIKEQLSQKIAELKSTINMLKNGQSEFKNMLNAPKNPNIQSKFQAPNNAQGVRINASNANVLNQNAQNIQNTQNPQNTQNAAQITPNAFLTAQKEGLEEFKNFNLSQFKEAINQGVNTNNLQNKLNAIQKSISSLSNAISPKITEIKNNLDEVKTLAVATKAAKSQINQIAKNDSEEALKSLQNDLKSVLLNLKENASQSGANNVTQAVNRLLTQIEIHQLASYSQNALQTYLPYIWEGVESSHVSYKRGNKNKFYARIELSFVKFGEVSVVLGLAENKFLDISIQTSKNDFKDMILQETTSLKKSLNEGGLIVNSFFLSNKNSQNAYEQLKEVDLGYNVKA